MSSVSIILPARDEAISLEHLLPNLIHLYPKAEIIVVNDASSDNTLEVCEKFPVTIKNHLYPKGNGAAIKTGARAAKGDILVFMDADGQHDPEEIENLLSRINEGYDMVVGARSPDSPQALLRKVANKIYNGLASIMTGYPVKDLTSGFRAVKTKQFKQYLYLLPNGFSYPTTITMAFFRSGYSTAYISVKVKTRTGTSKVKLIKDGIRFLVIIIKIGALFSPMRLFLPVSAFLFINGLFYYLYTYINYNRFTNMSALLFISSLITFLIGILSEQVSSLHYRHTEYIEDDNP